MGAAILGWLAVWWYPIVLFGVPALLIWWHNKNYNKWYNDPAVKAQRDKDAYDTAHAYLKGKCCCGRDKIED